MACHSFVVFQDSYAQITLLNAAGEEMVSNRTVTRRTQHHPVFAERYPFNIQESLLDQITLLITIINKRSTGKSDMNIGWISFGKHIIIIVIDELLNFYLYDRSWCQRQCSSCSLGFDAQCSRWNYNTMACTIRKLTLVIVVVVMSISFFSVVIDVVRSIYL